MEIEVRSDHNVDGREAVVAGVKGAVEHALRVFSYRITRVDVHLSDANGKKGGEDDKRCVVETRLKGRDAIVARGEAPTMDRAVSGAVLKMKRSIERALDQERYQD